LYADLSRYATLGLLSYGENIYNPNMSRAHSLYRLQEIDLALDKNNARLEEIQKILADSKELQKANANLVKAESALKESQTALKSAEYAVEAQRTKIEETEATLYSGNIKNPKELQDLQMEVESLNRYLSTLEDRLLDAMVEIEQVELDREAARNIVLNIEKAREAEHRDLHEEKQNLLEENERLGINREAALVSVTEEDLHLYHKIHEKQGGVVVARLEKDGSCSVCGLSPSASKQQLIRSGTHIEQCSHCKRILYAG
jgi:predicted  nucleic acid-binding Zn-ribbon protein